MNKEDIIRMAEEAGAIHYWHLSNLERFAALVIANHPPQSFMTWQEGYEAGKQTEREACAKVCEDQAEDGTEGEWDGCCLSLAKQIRARGQE